MLSVLLQSMSEQQANHYKHEASGSIEVLLTEIVGPSEDYTRLPRIDTIGN
jgi:hypothetical protein